MDLTEGSDLSELAYSSRPTTLISSVGGFSQPAIESIKSWSDLVRSLQPLKLERYESARLQESYPVGEGVSYSVFRSTDMLSGSSVAVKKIKLPLSPFNQPPSRARIGSILRDIEVMSHTPMAQHPNILSILGYGWELRAGTLLPFVVTEYASLGTLREYLMRDKIDARTRRELCYQVASGLHKLHLSSIAHGDLKLENVLVTPAEEIHTRKNRIPVVVKLSDFGHSLRFAPGTNLSLQRYQGTMWYNPPEVAQGRSSAKDLNLIKCDIWALGLFYWEVHRNGIPYYKDFCIQNLFSRVGSLDDQKNTSVKAFSKLSSESTETTSCMLLRISNFIATEAQNWVDQVLKGDSSWQLFDIIFLKAVFKNTLKADPVQRISNVSHLPLVHGNRDLRERSILMDSRLEEAQWSFMLFLREEMSQIPLGVKTEMLTDFEQLASRPHDSSEVVARAALHVAFARATSFGIIDSKPEIIRSLIQKSVVGGLHIAIYMKDLLERGLCNVGSAELTSNSLDKDNYNQTLKYTIKTLAKLGFAELKGISPMSTFASLLHAVKAVNQEDLVAHHSVLCYLTNVLPAKYVNIRSPISGETALALACRLGDYKAAQNLLDRGADPSICTADNCSPLHWIFMFDEKDMRNIDLSFFSGVNRVASRPQILDAQLPTDMEGTPLSFAVAAASLTAVDTLLVKFKGKIEPSTIRQACHKASSLYLHDIVKRLYHYLNSDPNPLAILNLGDLAKSSLVIQKLIHGSRLKMAAHSTIHVITEAIVKPLPTYHKIIGGITGKNHRATDLTQWILEGAKLAIHAGDLDLAQSILDTFSRKHVKLSQASAQLLAVEVSRVCAETAAGSIYTLPVSLQLLDFASHQSVRYGYKNNWVTSITTAIEYHRKDIFLHLLQRPDNVNAKTAEGMTVLHTMLRYHFQSICPVSTILLTGANPDITDNIGRTPLHLAIELGMDQEFDHLLTHQADIVTFDIYGNTPLHTALLCKRLSIIASILGHYSGPRLINELGERRRSALALAALEGLETATRLLLKAGACLSTIDADQRTPLHLAASGNTPGHLAVISLLLSKPEGVNVVDRNGNTSFNVFMMTQAGQHTLDLELCRCFLAAGTDLTISNKDGYSPILLSLDLFELTIFKRLLPLLVQYGANINDRDQNSLSPLDVAAFYGQADLTVCLLQYDALVNVVGNKILGGPLHCCVNQSNLSFSEYKYQWKSLQNPREKAIVAQHLLLGGADILRIDEPEPGPELEPNKFGVLSLEAFPNGKGSLVETKISNWPPYRLLSHPRPKIESSISSLPKFQRYPIFATLYEDNDLTRVLIQAHHNELGSPSGAIHLEVLQQSFDHAIDINSRAITYFLEARVPVDYSSLCTHTTAGSEFLASALYSDNKMILQRYHDLEIPSQFQSTKGTEQQFISLWERIATSPSTLEALKIRLARLIEADLNHGRYVPISQRFGQEVFFSANRRARDRTSIEVALDPVLKKIFSNEDVHFEDHDMNSSEPPGEN